MQDTSLGSATFRNFSEFFRDLLQRPRHDLHHIDQYLKPNGAIMTTRMFSNFIRLKMALIELLIAASPAAALFCPTDAGAQTQPWPNRVVKIAVGGNPGSGPDLVARVLAEHLSALWGQGVIVDNRMGGPGGNLAAQSVARAAPDGYTILVGILPPLAMNQYLFKSTGFDAERDFAPIIRICIVPMMISVNAALPVQNLADLVALSKSQPGKVFYATPGSRYLPEFIGGALNHAAGAGLTFVPHKTGGLAGQNTASGETQAYIDSLAAMAPWISGGRLRPIAVFGPSRIPGPTSLTLPERKWLIPLETGSKAQTTKRV